MQSFIDGYLIEINQFPRYDGGFYTIKDYFYHDSSNNEYGYRDTVIPVEKISNFNEIPDSETIRDLINKSVPIMKRVIDLNKQEETWIFQTSNLKGLDQK